MATTDLSTKRQLVGKVGILAGGGLLPKILAQELIQLGKTPYIANLEATKPVWIGTIEGACVSITKLSNLIKTLRNANVSSLVLAGSIHARPRLRDFAFDWRLYHEFPTLYRALKRGDDGLLRSAIGFLERQGFQVFGAHEIAPSLLAAAEVLTQTRPSQFDFLDIQRAISGARVLGGRDIGQAVVVRNGELIAQETRTGTAAMLEALLPGAPKQKNGVLVKWSKPNQELRVDLPSIGPDTVTQAVAAGLVGIVVEAGKSLILDRDEVVRRANLSGIFVAGIRDSV